MKKIEVPTDTPLELEDMAADIQWRREERVSMKREEESQK